MALRWRRGKLVIWRTLGILEMVPRAAAKPSVISRPESTEYQHMFRKWPWSLKRNGLAKYFVISHLMYFCYYSYHSLPSLCSW